MYSTPKVTIDLEQFNDLQDPDTLMKKAPYVEFNVVMQKLNLLSSNRKALSMESPTIIGNIAKFIVPDINNTMIHLECEKVASTSPTENTWRLKTPINIIIN